jgi:3,4-dihydroxy 2-butanone 4-phosphate synthase/GTP cyclohydrolase II
MARITLLLAEAASHRQRTGRPFVTLSYAQSLDGCIAATPGQPLALSGPESRQLIHQLRAAHDAILVGIGTVLADDPRLNVRLASGPNPQPVIVDSRLRFPDDAQLLQKTPLPWIVTTAQANLRRQKALEAAGAQVWRGPATPDGRVDLNALLDQLGQRGINTLMVEGGASIITNFLARRLVNRLVLTLAPIYLGGYRATHGLTPPWPQLRHSGYTQLGQDLIVTGDLVWEDTCND